MELEWPLTDWDYIAGGTVECFLLFVGDEGWVWGMDLEFGGVDELRQGSLVC